jgi:hypothetical protein
MIHSNTQNDEMAGHAPTRSPLKPDQGQAVRNPSADFAVTLTEEEREQLLNWLIQKLRQVLIEEHRTDAPDYKDYVRHQEEVLEKVMKKLRRR